MTDHTICPECKGPMKPLWGVKMFCPQDCDKPEVLAKRKADAEAKAKAALTITGPSGPINVYAWPTIQGTFNIPFQSLTPMSQYLAKVYRNHPYWDQYRSSP